MQIKIIGGYKDGEYMEIPCPSEVLIRPMNNVPFEEIFRLHMVDDELSYIYIRNRPIEQYRKHVGLAGATRFKVEKKQKIAATVDWDEIARIMGKVPE